MTLQLQPDDRILVLQTGSFSAAQLRAWASAVPHGILVGLGDPAAVRIARKELDDCENVLFTHGSREEIPWRDGFFTVVVDPETLTETLEIQRVLSPAGRIYSMQP